MKLRFFLVLTSGMLLASCKVGVPTPTGIQWGGLGKSRTGSPTLELKVGIRNPNPVGLKVVRLESDVLLNGSVVGRIQTPTGMRIRANSTEVYPISVAAQLQGIPGGLAGFLTGNLQFQVKGTGKVRYLVFFGKKFDFTWP